MPRGNTTMSDPDPWSFLISRGARVTLLLMTVSVPFVAFGAIHALKSTSNDPRQWLPRSFDETDKHNWFQQHFGADEISIVSWPGCRLDDPRVDQLTAALSESPCFERVYSGRSVLKQLIDPPLEVPLATGIGRLRGTLVGQDERATCLVLVTSEVGRADRGAAVREIKRLAASRCGLSSDELRLAGPTVDAAAIDAESRRLLLQLSAFSGVLTFVIAAMRLRSVRLAVMVLVGAVYSTGATLAALYFGGGSMNLLMTMLPPLIYVLSISAAVHVVNYYLDARETLPAQRAPAAALRNGWLPCVLAALTTAIGLLSLTISKIEPIRMFGASAAMGVLISLVVLFVFLPAALYLFPTAARVTSSTSPTHVPRRERFVEFISRRWALVTLSCLAVLVFFGLGLARVESTVKLQDRFLPDSEVIADYRWLEEQLGPMVPLEVVIRFDRDSQLDLLHQLQLVASIQQEIQKLPDAGATLSAADFMPPIPEGGGVRQVIQRTLLNERLIDGRQSLIDAHFLSEDTREHLWRISVRASALGSLDYGRFTDTLRQRVSVLIAKDGPQQQQVDVRATYTGVIPLIYKAQRQLLQDLVVSFFTAFAVIFVVLVVVLRSVSAAGVTMIPNLFPAVVVFGAMGWIRLPVQIGSVMTASAALGIAVDDTVHFLTWFRRGLNRGSTRAAALRDAYSRCAGAMFHTTVICSCGLLVFAASTFVPILHFAWLMVFLLLAALIGDLLLLPAMLAGPLGKCFRK